VQNVKSISLAILEVLAFNSQKFAWSRDPGHDHFRKRFSEIMLGLSLRACLPNLKFVTFAVLELFACNAEKFMWSCVPGHVHFPKLFPGVISRLSKKMLAKFEVRLFSYFGVICI